MRHYLLVAIFNNCKVGLTFTRPTVIGILAVVLSLSAALTVLVVTAPNGIGLTSDSVGYIAAARNLSAGRGLILSDSSPLTIQAPLYSTILSLLELISGLDPVDGARYINAGIFGLVVYLSGILFQRRLARTSFVIIGMTSVSLSPVLFFHSTLAFTESLFFLWTLVFLLLLNDYLKEGTSGRLILVAIVTGLACLTRYIGISFVVSGAAAVLFLRTVPFRSRLYHFMLFGALALAPLGLWAFRNFLLEGALFGGRDPSPYPLHHNLYFSLIRVINWFIPLDYLAQNLKYTKAHFVLGAMAGYLVGSVWSPGNAWNQLRVAVRSIGPEIFFFGTYTSVLVAVSTITAHEGINDRYMSPVYVPAVLIFLRLLESGLPGSASSFSIRILGLAGSFAKQRLVYAILVTWIAFLSARTTITAFQLWTTGFGYNHVDWRTSETISYLGTQILTSGDNLTILSNDPEAIYILLGVSSSSTPEATGYRSSEPRRPVASIAGKWPGSQKAFLVWFHKIERAHLYEVHELEQIAEFAVVEALEDGVIYEVSSR